MWKKKEGVRDRDGWRDDGADGRLCDRDLRFLLPACEEEHPEKTGGGRGRSELKRKKQSLNGSGEGESQGACAC